VKNSTPFIPPLYNIERNPILIAFSGLITIVLIFINFTLFEQMNPAGFMLLIITSIISFQTLWFLLNPFALVYQAKILIKYSIFKSKEWYFIDVLKISFDKKNRIFITYKDGEIVKLSTFGIKPSHLSVLKNEIEKNIS
jgi:hypothetical protein